MAKATSNSNLPLSELTALSPLDGRYRNKTASLATYFSEFSLVRIRVEIETVFIASLSKHKIIRQLTTKERGFLESLGPEITISEVGKIKSSEEILKHDVKALELYLRKKLQQTSMQDLIEYLHFGLTSEDINNITYRLMLKRASENALLPKIKTLLGKLVEIAKTHKHLPMLARTHGQAAVPTTLGKEMVVYASRIQREYQKLTSYQFSGKLAGAVGNYNALTIAFPQTDWIGFSNDFVAELGFSHTHAVTQINTYEDIIEFFQIIQRLNNILIDFDQDMWRYISDHWFIQDVKKDEIGSSTMPQKVNPILFENSEGNLGLANTMIDFYSRKLPISRLQRDLSDSTVIRNFGSTFGYNLLGLQGLCAGLERVRPNEKAIEDALMSDWSILSEAAQTILRKHGTSDPYSLLKNLTRGEPINELRWKEIIHELPIEEGLKQSLLALTPKKYVGLSAQIVEVIVQDINL